MWQIYAGFAIIGTMVYLVAAVTRGEFIPSLLIGLWDIMGLLVLFGPAVGVWFWLQQQSTREKTKRLVIGAVFVASALVYVLMVNARQDIFRAL